MNAKGLVFLVIIGTGLTAFPATMAVRSFRERTWWCLPLAVGVCAVLASIPNNSEETIYIFAALLSVAVVCFFTQGVKNTPQERSALFGGQHFWAVFLTIGVLAWCLAYASIHRYTMQQDSHTYGVRVLDQWTGDVKHKP